MKHVCWKDIGELIKLAGDAKKRLVDEQKPGKLRGLESMKLSDHLISKNRLVRPPPLLNGRPLGVHFGLIYLV